jgi:hypothetical protein
MQMKVLGGDGIVWRNNELDGKMLGMKDNSAGTRVDYALPRDKG